MKTITLFVAIPLYICSLHYNFFVLDHIKNLDNALNKIDFEDQKFKSLYFDHFAKIKEDDKTTETKLY